MLSTLPTRLYEYQGRVYELYTGGEELSRFSVAWTRLRCVPENLRRIRAACVADGQAFYRPSRAVQVRQERLGL